MTRVWCNNGNACDMSRRIGCSREMVSRLLKDLIRGNYIELAAGGRLRLLKRLPQRW